MTRSKLAVLTIRLNNWVHDAQVHRVVQVANDCRSLGAVKLVGLEDGLLLPVAPVHGVLEHRHGERMRQDAVGVDDGASAEAVKVAAAQRVHLGVDPEEQLGEVVDGETVGPHHVGVHDDLSLDAVHACALDLRVESPVGPEHESGAWVDLNSSGLVHTTSGDQRRSLEAVQTGYADGIHTGVSPVKVPVDPIDGDTIGSLHGCNDFCVVGFDVSTVGEKRKKPKCSEIVNITHR